MTPPCIDADRPESPASTAVPPERPAPVGGEPPAPAESARILLIDADRAVREACAELFLRTGFRVDSEDDAASGWAALRATSYDLLVLDYRLPHGSGLRVIAKLRAARMTLPVILIAGAIEPDELRRNARLNLSATINRPFSAAQLLDLAVLVLQHADRAPLAARPAAQLALAG